MSIEACSENSIKTVLATEGLRSIRITENLQIFLVGAPPPASSTTAPQSQQGICPFLLPLHFYLLGCCDCIYRHRSWRTQLHWSSTSTMWMYRTLSWLPLFSSSTTELSQASERQVLLVRVCHGNVGTKVFQHNVSFLQGRPSCM